MPTHDKLNSLALKYAKQFDSTVLSRDIKLLGKGYNSNGYKIFSDKVLLLENETSQNSLNYANEFAILTALKDYGYRHSPLPLWLSEDRKSMVISIAEGKALRNFDLSLITDKKELALKIIDVVFDMFDTPYDLYQRTCIKLSIEPKKVESRKDTYNIYQKARFEEAQGILGKNNKYIKWLSLYLPTYNEFNFNQKRQKTVLSHGDVGSGHIFINLEDRNIGITLIDWGIARYNEYSPVGNLAYILKSDGLFANYKNEIIGHIAKKTGQDSGVLKKRVKAHIKVLKTHNILWNVWMYSLAQTKKIEADPEYFLDRAKERILKYEKEYIIGNL